MPLAGGRIDLRRSMAKDCGRCCVVYVSWRCEDHKTRNIQWAAVELAVIARQFSGTLTDSRPPQAKHLCKHVAPIDKNLITTIQLKSYITSPLLLLLLIFFFFFLLLQLPFPFHKCTTACWDIQIARLPRRLDEQEIGCSHAVLHAHYARRSRCTAKITKKRKKRPRQLQLYNIR